MLIVRGHLSIKFPKSICYYQQQRTTNALSAKSHWESTLCAKAKTRGKLLPLLLLQGIIPLSGFLISHIHFKPRHYRTTAQREKQGKGE